MTRVNSTARPRASKATKPDKPQKDYPLTAHPCGLWCKKVRGKLYYFGPWADPQAALDRWLADKDALLAGRVPRSRAANDEPVLGDLVTRFLQTKLQLRDNGELSPHTWNAYADVCDQLLETFGQDRLLSDLLPEDFEKLRAKWAATWGLTRLGAEIIRARTVFIYAYKNCLIPTPIVFGEGFSKPSLKSMRIARAAKGEKMFERDELRHMIKEASQPLTTMLLMGINGALGNADIARLAFSAFDLKTGWLTYSRGKTGTTRKIPLWPETIASVKAWMTKRPQPKDPENFELVFITARGNAWDKGAQGGALSHECRKLLDTLKIDGHRSFYALRHTFETVAGESRDQVAVDAVMGHSRNDMASVYRERISDDRLKAVVDFVHAWLFAKPAKGAKGKPRLRIRGSEEDGAASG